ncbi:MAG: diacylglycerol kinase [Pseudomonadota bacterium]
MLPIFQTKTRTKAYRAPTKAQPLTGAARVLAAFQNSFAGFRDIYAREEAFRQEFALFLVGIPVSFLIGTSAAHVIAMILSILILLIVEILNSAIETAIDRIGPEIHELSRIAKDLGSLSVLLASLIPLTVWGYCFTDWAGWID